MSVERLDLPIDGMTCASCAARVERKLNELTGVDAAVNYATERASVEFDAERRQPERSSPRSRRPGYRAALPGDAAEAAAERYGRDASLAAPRLGPLTVPVLALAMVPPLQFAGWEWVSLALATPVVFWGGWPFHRAAF